MFISQETPPDNYPEQRVGKESRLVIIAELSSAVSRWVKTGRMVSEEL